MRKTHYPILWENEKKISAGFQMANTRYIEAEIVIVVKRAAADPKCSTSLSDESSPEFSWSRYVFDLQTSHAAARMRPPRSLLWVSSCEGCSR